MTVALAGDVAGGGPAGSASGAAGGTLHPGRITYDDRVFVKIAEQVATQAVGVSRQDLGVKVERFRDGLALAVRLPLPVPDLDDRAAIDAGDPVLERIAALQQLLGERVGALTGSDVVRVDVTVTGAVIEKRSRVR